MAPFIKLRSEKNDRNRNNANSKHELANGWLNNDHTYVQTK